MNICHINMLSSIRYDGYIEYMKLSKEQMQDRLRLIIDLFKMNVPLLKEESTLLLNTVRISCIEIADSSMKSIPASREEKMTVEVDVDDDELSGEIVYDDSCFEEMEETQITITEEERLSRLGKLKTDVQLLLEVAYKCSAILSYLNIIPPSEFKESENDILLMSQTLINKELPRKEKLIFKFNGKDKLELPAYFWNFLFEKCGCFKEMDPRSNLEDIDFSTIPVEKNHFQLLLCHMTHPDCLFLLIEDNNHVLKELSLLRPLIESLHCLDFKWEPIHSNNDTRLANHLRSLHKLYGDRSEMVFRFLYEIARQSLNELAESRKVFEDVIINLHKKEDIKVSAAVSAKMNDSDKLLVHQAIECLYLNKSNKLDQIFLKIDVSKVSLIAHKIIKKYLKFLEIFETIRKISNPLSLTQAFTERGTTKIILKKMMVAYSFAEKQDHISNLMKDDKFRKIVSSIIKSM